MLEIGIFLALMLLGYVFGQIAEARHYRSILQREKQTLNLPVITLKTAPEALGPCRSQLVSGSVVVSIDFFKKFVAGLRALVGGRMKSYETLLDRARREAVLRMKESALEKNASIVINVRIETSSISKSSRSKESVGSVEVLAYGTALST